MKLKVVIMRPDRKNDTLILHENRVKGNVFVRGDYEYFIDADRFQITEDRPFLFKRYYRTFYYALGNPKPLPVPDFKALARPARDENGQIVKDKEGNTVMDWGGILNDGVSPEELKALFNPFFYNIIAQGDKNNWQQMLFYLTCANAAGIGWLLFKMGGF